MRFGERRPVTWLSPREEWAKDPFELIEAGIIAGMRTARLKKMRDECARFMRKYEPVFRDRDSLPIILTSVMSGIGTALIVSLFYLLVHGVADSSVLVFFIVALFVSMAIAYVGMELYFRRLEFLLLKNEARLEKCDSTLRFRQETRGVYDEARADAMNANLDDDEAEVGMTTSRDGETAAAEIGLSDAEIEFIEL